MIKSTIKLTLAVAIAVALVPGTGSAAAWTSCTSGAKSFTSWNNGGFTVEADVWGPAPGTECIWANSYHNWGVTANHSGNRIESYPNVDKQNINVRVASLGTVTSSFNASSPSNTKYDQAYDIWLNGKAYEIMIWNRWSGTQPIAASYDASGNAVPSYRNQSIGGVTYNVYHRGSVTSFLRTSQTSATTVNIKSVLQWINNTPKYYSNPSLTKIQNGWEIIYTGGSTKSFTMNSYSCTAN